MPPNQIDSIRFVPKGGTAAPQGPSSAAAQKTIDGLRAQVVEKRNAAARAMSDHLAKGVQARNWIRGEREALEQFEADALAVMTAVANAAGYDVSFEPAAEPK